MHSNARRQPPHRQVPSSRRHALPRPRQGRSNPPPFPQGYLLGSHLSAYRMHLDANAPVVQRFSPGCAPFLPTKKMRGLPTCAHAVAPRRECTSCPRVLPRLHTPARRVEDAWLALIVQGLPRSPDGEGDAWRDAVLRIRKCAEVRPAWRHAADKRRQASRPWGALARSFLGVAAQPFFGGAASSLARLRRRRAASACFFRRLTLGFM